MSLKIFPAYGLENSLLTAILVGLYIRFFFNEWLGWVFSGLVVPGYLACIVLLRPASAAVIIVEALITFMLVRGMSNTLSRTGLGNPLFGRDRFVWLVVASVGVRVAVEALVAPPLESLLRARFGWDPADSFGFYGIGMVLVPLLANACWKPGLVRGCFQQLVCTAITYFIILGLLSVTNLSFAKVAQGFDQLTLDFTASPKAYMILLAGVLIASRFNLRFGWDTSGVVIPGLIALAWFAPIRILTTIGESLLIVLGVTLFLRLPIVRNWNVEGPRRIVLLFTCGYIIKFAIIALFGTAPGGFESTALFGIGYLLPSLLAVKILQRRNPALILFPSVALSIAGVVSGSVVGFGLLLGGAALQARLGAPPKLHEEGSCGSTTELVSEIRLARARIARTMPTSEAPRIAWHELRSLSSMVRQLRTLTGQGVVGCSQLVAQVHPGTLGLRLQTATSPSGRSFLVMYEQTVNIDQLRGFGMIVLAAKPTGGPVLVVDQPQRALADLSALVTLVDLVSADGIVIGGLPVTDLGRGDAVRDHSIALRIAAEALVSQFWGQVVTVRTGQIESPGPQVGIRVSPVLVKALESKLGPVSRVPTLAEATIELSPTNERQLAAPLTPKLEQFPNVGSWLAAVPVVPRIAPQQSAFADMLLAEEVIRPLARAHAPLDLSELGREVSGPAHELGLSIGLIDSAGLHPRISVRGHGEGVVVEPRAAGGALIEVVSRRVGVAELAASLYEAQAAHALLIGVTIPGASDAGPLARVAAPILALTPPLPPAILLRSGMNPSPDCAVISDTATGPTPLAERLNVTLGSLGIHCESRTQYDSDVLEPPSRIVDLLRARATGDFVTLHVGPELRERFRPSALSIAQLQLFTRLKIPAVRASMEKSLVTFCSAPTLNQAGTIPELMLRDAREFAATRHPAIVERLREQADQNHLELRVIDDQDLAEVYLLITGKKSAAAVSMRTPATEPISISCSSDVAVKVQQAHARGAASIAVGQAP